VWFENFIKNEEFNHNYQPIYNLNDWVVIGYEVFLTSKIFSNPEETFELARKRKRLYELDSRSIHKAIDTYIKAGFSKKHGRLFINVFPSTLQNENFQSFIIDIMCNLQVSCQQIVLEILKSEQIEDYSNIKKSMDSLKKQGFLFALDEYGKGNSDIKRILELDPDYIKLDRYFTVGLIKSREKQFVLKSVKEYCQTFGKQLILEGLELPEDLAFAKLSGITYGQGYALGKPQNIKEII
jgi:EAL domain-containing protein (putative c-di-GMP-specific phosphodiesterase class I)